MSEAYQELGGLARPDAYFGAIEFDCPTCQAKGKTLESDGEKCRQYIDRVGEWRTKRCPCKDRLKLASKAGLI